MTRVVVDVPAGFRDAWYDSSDLGQGLYTEWSGHPLDQAAARLLIEAMARAEAGPVVRLVLPLGDLGRRALECLAEVAAEGAEELSGPDAEACRLAARRAVEAGRRPWPAMTPADEAAALVYAATGVWPERPDQRDTSVVEGRTGGPVTSAVRSRTIPPHLRNAFDLSRNAATPQARAYWARHLAERLAEHQGDQTAG